MCQTCIQPITIKLWVCISFKANTHESSKYTNKETRRKKYDKDKNMKKQRSHLKMLISTNDYQKIQ